MLLGLAWPFVALVALGLTAWLVRPVLQSTRATELESMERRLKALEELVQVLKNRVGR